MNDILDKIGRYKRQEITLAKQETPLRVLERQVAAAPKPRGFIRAIEREHALGAYALIAEIKKASPSKGLIRADFEPGGLARAYEKGGAACLSVLTDLPSFAGSRTHLADARNACALPLLRKDFIYDPYQCWQSRAWGADCILIIMAAVDDRQARDIAATAHDLEMDVLVEVHDGVELDRALDLGTRLVGINNRDLRSFAVDLAVAERLAPRIPADRIVVGESGIVAPADCARLGAAGIRTFLVGESLMRQDDVAAATRTLLGRSALAR